MSIFKNNKFIQLWLIIGIIAGFAAILFFVVTYLNERVLCNLDCRIRNEVNLLLVMLSLFGMFIGSLTYYFISEKYEKKIIKIHRDASQTLKFLEGEEKDIISALIKNKGEITQSDIVKHTGLSRVKVSRGLKKLEQKKIISKIPNGMTNKVELKEDFKKFFVD